MVIEHPEWIPEAWQAQLDLYAGHDQGRIYRLLRDPSAPVRTNGLRLPAAVERLDTLHALDQSGELTDRALRTSLGDPHPGIVREAIRMAESRLSGRRGLLSALLSLADHEDIRVRYQLALTLGETSDDRAADALLAIADHDPDDVWIRTAVLTSAVPHALPMLTCAAGGSRNDRSASAASGGIDCDGPRRRRGDNGAADCRSHRRFAPRCRRTTVAAGGPRQLSRCTGASRIVVGSKSSNGETSESQETVRSRRTDLCDDRVSPPAMRRHRWPSVSPRCRCWDTNRSLGKRTSRF